MIVLREILRELKTTGGAIDHNNCTLTFEKLIEGLQHGGGGEVHSRKTKGGIEAPGTHQRVEPLAQEVRRWQNVAILNLLGA